MNYLSAVDDWFLDFPGGMGRVARDVALLMRGRGHRVALLCAKPQARAELPASESVDGLRIVRYDRPVLPGWDPRRPRRLIAAAAQAAREHLGGERWDIVHMHSPFTGTGAADVLAPGPRLVYTMHSPMVLEQEINWSGQGWRGRLKLALGRGVLRRIEGDLLRRCDAIQTLSQYTRDQIERFHGLGSRVSVIPHWPSPLGKRDHTRAEARQRLGWPPDEPILFTIRRHGARYGLDIAIRAVGPLAAEGRCRFVVGGDGPMRPALQQLAAELKAGERIVFPGRLSDDDLRLAYQAADLFILPTLALECFGLITIEAFSYGCPVLSTDVGAIPETMRPILPDFIVAAGDVAALRDKVERFLSSTLRAPSPDELVRYAQENYGQEKLVPRIAALLESSAARPN